MKFTNNKNMLVKKKKKIKRETKSLMDAKLGTDAHTTLIQRVV